MSTRLSVSFGLNEVDPGAYFGWQGNLRNPESDASVNSTITTLFGFDENRVHMRQNATRAQFRDVFLKDGKLLNAGDTLVIPYSGHGGKNGETETLVLHDGELPDYEIWNLVASLKPGVNFLLIADCCHAGGLDRANDPFNRPKFMHPLVAEKMVGRPTNGMRDELKQFAAVFGACLSDQTASDGLYQGVWTDCLRKSFDDFRKSGQPMTWREWFDGAAVKSSGQTPRLGLMSETAPFLDNLVSD